MRKMFWNDVEYNFRVNVIEHQSIIAINEWGNGPLQWLDVGLAGQSVISPVSIFVFWKLVSPFY